MFIKICGITNLEDAISAFEAGCDAIGFVFAESPRRVSQYQAREIIRQLPQSVKKVGVFVNERQDRVREIVNDCSLDIVQLHGDETPDYCLGIEYPIIKAFRLKSRKDVIRLKDYRVALYLLDSYTEGIYKGNLKLIKEAKVFGPIILAGGLNPSNVVEAIREVEPYGVDVSRGVELMPGKKDPNKIRAFVDRVKRCQDISMVRSLLGDLEVH